MRRWIVSLSVLFSGCGFLNGLGTGDAGGMRYLDPSKVYLDHTEEVAVHRFDEDVGEFACLSGAPLLCEKFGVEWNCSCPF